MIRETFAIRNVRVLAAPPSPPPPPPPPPPPAFDGTEIAIHLDASDPTFGLCYVTLAPDSAAYTVDWGDGMSQTFTETTTGVHTYSQPGDYRVRLSDDCDTLRVISSDEDAAKITEVVCTAKKLMTIGTVGLKGCVNMATADFRNSSVEQLARRSFAGCTKLSGELYFPSVKTLVKTSSVFPFSECTGGITKIHFGAANEEIIKAGDAYQADQTLGTGTAVCVFDL